MEQRITCLYLNAALRAYKAIRRLSTCFMFIAVVAATFSSPVMGQASQANPAARTERDGAHDFDFEIGTWKTHLRRLLHPLTGSSQWVTCEGISTVQKIWNGKANMVQLEADCPDGHFEGLNLRLYDPQSRQWSLNFANSKVGSFSQPTIGQFKDDRGEFYDQETLNGRAIFVRFVILKVDANTTRFEQSFSDDGGKTWELNWVAVDSRVPGESNDTH